MILRSVAAEIASIFSLSDSEICSNWTELVIRGLFGAESFGTCSLAAVDSIRCELLPPQDREPRINTDDANNGIARDETNLGDFITDLLMIWKLQCWNDDRRYTCTATREVQRAFPQ